MSQTTNKTRTETTTLPARQFTVEAGRSKIQIGQGHPLSIISGPCVIDSREMIMNAARQLSELSQRVGIGLIFKSSYEKDNRGSEKNWTGPMADDGLKILEDVRKEFGLPVLTDVHRVEDVARVAESVDVLQIPAYMCQQTSLVVACGKTGKPVNIKKGQFLAPENMSGAVSKIHSTGNKNVLLTERGACFGYNRLVADMRSIPVMQELGAPVCFDATHVIRLYGISSADPAGGEPRFVPHLTMAAVAAGTDALFIEAHPDPMSAKCDAASQLNLKHWDGLIRMAMRVRQAIGTPENVGQIHSPQS
ncbi:MAG TPA: 3-deoxy-8-phosphooctulonate synthase [Pseudobdellovibrionaceae bacterium]|nr:3-deoxy-8-phosphooctulonate synthase [Pseudobdellovibrionaceae bacterium]